MNEELKAEMHARIQGDADLQGYMRELVTIANTIAPPETANRIIRIAGKIAACAYVGGMEHGVDRVARRA